jgi:hypothetical protein
VATGRSAVAPVVDCASAVWTNAGFWVNASSCVAFAPAEYITTPEISAAVIPVAYEFISVPLSISPVGFLRGNFQALCQI